MFAYAYKSRGVTMPRFSLCSYAWHSINIVPSVDTYLVCSDDDPSDATSAVEVVVFGRIVRIVLPLRLSSRALSTGIRGPLWSRRRRRWYSVEEV